MAQGKLKVKAKTKLPPTRSTKRGKVGKGTPSTKRANIPKKPKKLKESQRLKEAFTKTLHSSMEAEIRAKAGKSTNHNLSKAQQAVIKHNKSSNK